MAFRDGVVILSALILVPTAGCSLARGALTPAGGGMMDAGEPDVGTGGRDTGPRPDTGVPMPDTGVPMPDGGGCATSCDDANPCTDDACDTTGSCTHTPNAASCDDGVLCNGADTCGAGSCSVHDGVDPCPGMSHCDATSDMCMGCGADADCPADVPGAWGTCDFTNLCATTGGSQMRQVQTYHCDHGTCATGMRAEMQACTRPSTDGNMCAAPAYGPFSPCDFGTDLCTLVGSQTRTTTLSHCAGGSCVAVDSAETTTCTRPSTDGASCGMPTVSDWSACVVGSGCGATGTQSRTTTTPACAGGVCTTSSTTETQSCMSTGGPSICGTTMCPPFGACTQTMPNTCNRTGTQSRTCSTPVCAGTTCSGSITSMESQACAVDVHNLPCQTISCSNCRESGRLDCRSGHTGSQYCGTTNGHCADGLTGIYCSGGTSYGPRACTCP